MKRHMEEINGANGGSILPNVRRACGKRKIKRISVSRGCPRRDCTPPNRNSPSTTQAEAESAIPVEGGKSAVTSTFGRLLPIPELMDETELERNSDSEVLTQEYYLPQFTPINKPSPFSADVVRTAGQSSPSIRIRVPPVHKVKDEMTTLKKPSAPPSPPSKLIIPDIIIHSPSPSFSPITPPEALSELEDEGQ
ncbi:hypothetical protein MMC29_001696 [Sticta canariensis]|nr:hypothetical protein [Sticta canariensis]